MLEILGTVFGSIFSGGATGILGVIAQRFADYKNKQLDMQLEKQRGEIELQKREADARIMAQEWAGRTKVAEVEADATKSAAADAAFAESFKMEPQKYTTGELTTGQRWFMVLLDVLRGSVRPLLTVYLCALTTMVYLQARMLLAKEDLDAATAMDLEKMIVGSILYLTTTCILWYFGTRNKQSQS